MKTLLSVLVLMICFCQAKAQQLFYIKPADTMLTGVTIEKYLKSNSQSNWKSFTPIQSLNDRFTTNVKPDNMPIAVLKAYDHMPIAVLSGYDRMPVKGFNKNKPDLLKQVPLPGLPTFTNPY